MPPATLSPTQLPLMVGLPDSRQVLVSARPDGSLNYAVLGNSRISNDLGLADRQRLIQVIFGPGVPLRLAPGLRGRPIVNGVADADLSAVALGMLDQHVGAASVACFNHPRAVLGTSRDAVAAKLARIAGLHVPRTVKLSRIDEPADLLRAAAEHGLEWPLIVRIAGSHRGTATAKIDRPEQLVPGLRGLAWGGRSLYLTEYVDCCDADGFYRKWRLVVVGRDVFIRHLVIARDWLVHAHDRDLGQLREEEALLRSFRSARLPELRERLDALADAIGMDYFGIDCNLRPDGRLLIFEVNALMDILINTLPQPNCWEQPIAEIREALSALLFNPTHWRYPPQTPSA